MHERTQELHETQLELIRRLGQAAELRDDDTGLHIERMSRLCQRPALAAGMSHDEALTMRHAYPAGLRGEEIPLPGRIPAVCDVFDALTSERAYKQRWTVRDALDEIVRERGRHFDPRLVDLVVALLEPAAPRPAPRERERERVLS